MSDTLTKVLGDHTIKVGFFYEWIRNSQPENNNTNGYTLVSAGNTFSYGNEYADLLTGNLNYNEATIIVSMLFIMIPLSSLFRTPGR